MPSTAIESVLLGGGYGHDRMREIFSDESLVQALLTVEAALARSEAALGMIPDEAAQEIARQARVENFSIPELRKGLDTTGHSLISLVRALAEACEGSAGGYVHWGATTQDIYDTAHTLQHREAIQFVLEQLYLLRQHLARLAEREADTLIAGRTHGQHALPTTFGYKVAVWCWEINRQIERWEQAKPRVLVGNLTGAVGTYAGFGGHGREVERLTMEELGLAVPEICWHSSRDRSAELGALLTLTAGSLEKIAGELYRLTTTEYAEVEEFFVMGTVGSSTMPHKRNPKLCEAVLSSCKAIRAEASMLFEATVQEQERHSGFWKTEWVGLPNGFILLGGALAKLDKVVAELQVYRGRMEKNLELSHGAILSEAVMLELGRFVGRQRAHDIIYEACMKAFDEGLQLKECLLEVPEVTAHLSREDLERLFDYRSYIGLAAELAREPARVFLSRA